MEDKKEKATAWLKGKVEAFRGWKRIWKVLFIFCAAVILLVGAFFAIPNPYRDAWDDLFLPYPEEFPEPGVYGEHNNIKVLTRAEMPPMDREKYISRQKTADMTRPGTIGLPEYNHWGLSDIIVDAEILNYTDIEIIGDDRVQVYCMIKCKIHRIFAQRKISESTGESQAQQVGDIITIRIPASSKIAVTPYPEIAVGQRWMLPLQQMHPAAVVLMSMDNKDASYMITKWLKYAFSVPIKLDDHGNAFADTTSMELCMNQLENGMYAEHWKKSPMFPKDLIDQKEHKITDMGALSEFMQKAMYWWDHDAYDKGYRLSKNIDPIE